MSLLVVGSVAFDSLETPYGKAEEVLGGSASFFSVTASRRSLPVIGWGKRTKGNDLNVKTAAFILQTIRRNNVLPIILFGLKDGFFIRILLKYW